MDILDRLLGHDAWTTEQLLLRCRELTDEQFDHDFDLGLRTLRRTLEHIVRNLEVWTDLVRGVDVRRGGGCTVDALLTRLRSASTDLAEVATALARDGRLDDLWLDRLDEPPREKSYGGAIAHVLTHGMHHRCQVIHMLRRLGLDDVIEGDVLSWEAQRAPER